MNWQYIIVVVVIAAALLFAGRTLLARSRSFSVKKKCKDDCGCGD